jgi:hypothetical protein
MGFMKRMLSKLKGVQETEPIQDQDQELTAKEINDSFTTVAEVIPPAGPCTICGQAPMAVLIPHNGGMVWACRKKAHQARPKDRQELKKFKQLQKKMEQRGSV